MPDVIGKSKATKLEKYGTLSPIPVLSAALMEKYGVSCTWDIPGVREKCKDTMLKRYGVEYSLELSSVHEAARQTKLAKYGDENYHNTEKMKATKLERYGDENYNNVEKAKMTMLSCYGVDNNMKSPDGLSAYSKAIREKYGVDFMPELDDFQRKARQTYFERTGYEHPSQNPDVQKKAKSPYIFQGVLFKTSWELAFYIWHADRGIGIEYSPAISFPYTDDTGKQHTYHPDFKVNDKLYELKLAITEDDCHSALRQHYPSFPR